MLQKMQAAMQAAGFVGVEEAGGVIYARTYAAVPEFTVTSEGTQWRFAIQSPLRVSAAQRAAWNALHPDAPLDVDLGETRLQFLGSEDELARWAALVNSMVASCTAWRRITRQMDEGM
jgi:hypothetical protein